MKKSVNVGIVGTGYVAQKRAEALKKDERANLRYFVGNSAEKTEIFAQRYSVEKLESWWDLVNHPDLDLVFVSTINRDHGKIVRASIEAGKNVVVEYPLSLEAAEAQELIQLAKTKGVMIHVEHIELLGGVHQAIQRYLPEIGTIFYTRYVTISPQRPVGLRWTYNQKMFGFPLIGALSRIHRLVDLFGQVSKVACEARFWAVEGDYYKACISQAQLSFQDGLLAEVTYGKGETFWQGARTFELHGEKGLLIFEGEEGHLIRGEEKIALELPERKGLIAKDTILVLDHLWLDTPMYITPEESYYSLKVAECAAQSTQNNQMIYIDS